MSSGLYDMSAKDFDKTLDLTMLKPYGDTMNDGKVQLSFTLPVPNDDRGMEAARLISRQMGLSEPNVAYARALDKEFTFYVVYGSCTHSVDYTKIKIHAIEDKAMEMDEVDEYIREHIGRKIVVIGASTGTDAHTVGIDAIMNRKGFAAGQGARGECGRAACEPDRHPEEYPYPEPDRADRTCGSRRDAREPRDVLRRRPDHARAREGTGF